ncbi:transcriptional regulator with XRE-family HTH domain [Plantactinospora soyae]|uniref:Transcriptional regulator with XRE-family HTH domain n=1 Tax=Plantactinospora soyae TaxID=1544732 RepID=A0A927M9L4_9ACTN|nr:helix-turn-helix transcriptional regulator [Plantactinospora soyae]MBE1489161.1 transcriptional regulator with XRE-family HTH domain [Plantactinospora soyae]
MPGPERPLDGLEGPVAQFAAGLRQLRDKAGKPGYRQMAGRANYSPATLSAAASGRRLPTLEVTLAYVAACDGDVQQWEWRWREVERLNVAPAEDPDTVNGHERSPYPGWQRFSRRMRRCSSAVPCWSASWCAACGSGGSWRCSILRAPGSHRWSGQDWSRPWAGRRWC